METIEIRDLKQWDEFVRLNTPALDELDLTSGEAMTKAMQGGLVIGGGSAPQFLVVFVD